MRGFRVSSALCAAAVAIALLATATRARADITIYDNDGWSLYAKGLVASHFQYAFGDGDPVTTHGVLIGGKILPGGAQDALDQSFKLSRVRSGFIGTQMGWGVRRQISETVRIDSLIAVNLADISSNRNQEANKSVDVREAWASLITPGGTFRFGRMYRIFGSASAPIVLISHRYAVGNPCFVNAPTIACASVGAGPLYAGFDAQLRYESPRLAGFQFQVSISDPDSGPSYQMTPYPRADAELNFDHAFGASARLRGFAQGVFEQIQRRDDVNNLQKANVNGVMGTGLLDVAGLSVGGGAWLGTGIGTRTVFEIGDSSEPLAYSNATKALRQARGFFGNAGYSVRGITVAAGAGIAYVTPLTDDADPANTSGSILKSSSEYHATLTKQFDSVVLTAEYMHWHNSWHFDEKQDQTYTGVGANFFW
jgi:predicted porin